MCKRGRSRGITGRIINGTNGSQEHRGDGGRGDKGSVSAFFISEKFCAIWITIWSLFSLVIRNFTTNFRNYPRPNIFSSKYEQTGLCQRMVMQEYRVWIIFLADCTICGWTVSEGGCTGSVDVGPIFINQQNCYGNEDNDWRFQIMYTNRRCAEWLPKTNETIKRGWQEKRENVPLLDEVNGSRVVLLLANLVAWVLEKTDESGTLQEDFEGQVDVSS